LQVALQIAYFQNEIEIKFQIKTNGCKTAISEKINKQMSALAMDQNSELK